LPIRNRFEYWRLQLAAKHGKEISQKDMAKILNIDYSQYNKWETTSRPPNGSNLWTVWSSLQNEFPNLNMQDLLEYTP